MLNNDFGSPVSHIVFEALAAGVQASDEVEKKAPAQAQQRHAVHI